MKFGTLTQHEKAVIVDALTVWVDQVRKMVAESDPTEAESMANFTKDLEIAMNLLVTLNSEEDEAKIVN